MKKILVSVLVALLLVATLAVPAMADKGGKNADCIKIQDGILVDAAGNPLTVGYDQYGYNYQAHLFNGFYENYYRPETPVTESDTYLQMKWNDAWLSNKSCDGDFLLDRHFGYSSYIGSGAWLTNHMWGTYEENGETYHWNYFCKIVAAPANAYFEAGYWYTADGVEIGPVIWGQFAIIQEVSNDQGIGEHGLLYKSPASAGFGYYQP